ncbi:MAG: hypothetical protein Q7S76_00775 [bacterium]|nr:hypothetical protein [bacterium]
MVRGKPLAEYDPCFGSDVALFEEIRAVRQALDILLKPPTDRPQPHVDHDITGVALWNIVPGHVTQLIIGAHTLTRNGTHPENNQSWTLKQLDEHLQTRFANKWNPLTRWWEKSPDK